MNYDLIVTGGGPAGIGAAYTAASCGAKTLLIEKSGRLGGMAVQAMVGPLMGYVESRIIDEILRKLGGRSVDFQSMDIKLYEILSGMGVEILLHCDALEPVIQSNTVTGLRCKCREGIREFKTSCVVDATGDGDLAFNAGLPYAQGRNGDRLCQPMSIMYTIAGIDEEKRICCESEEMARVVKVLDRSWEELVLEARAKGELPESVGIIRLYKSIRKDENVVNATQVNFLDGTRSADLTKAEIEGRKQAFQILDFVKKTIPGYENAFISAMPAAIGVRETRRFRGVEQLVKEDCLEGKRLKNAIVRKATFPIDIHNPAGCGQAAGNNGKNAGTAERGKPYDIPFGVMLPEKLDGFLFTGRCISASHEALASCRVMIIAMALGAAAGAAAALAAKDKIKVREVQPEQMIEILF